jgi:hypothetical protein
MTAQFGKRISVPILRMEQLEERTVPAIIFNEGFDTTAVGALPAGWTATNADGIDPLWAVDTTNLPTPVSDAGGKSVWVDDPGDIADKLLTSPTINIPSAGTQLRFRQIYSLEGTFDGGVLEIAIGNNAILTETYADIVTAGGTFESGGYSGTVSSSFSNPIAGRSAWTGTITAWTTVLVNLPSNTAGQPVRFRWRMGSDFIESDTGWRVDTVQVGTPNLVAFSGGSQSARIGEPFANPLVAQVTSQFGSPLQNVTVTFNSPATGAGATFPGGNTAITNVAGIATVSVVANGIVGPYTVNSTFGGSTLASFALRNTPNLPPINVTAGGPYLATDQDTIIFQATATDPEGQPLTYTWDLNGDGVFNDALGSRLTLTPLQLDSLNIKAGFSTSIVKVRVSDQLYTVESAGVALTVSTFVPLPPPPPPVVVLPPPPAIQLTAISAGPGGGPRVTVLNANGSQRFEFFAYDPSFRGGITVATGDVNGDGIEDVITGAGAGGGPHVKVYDGATGKEFRSFFAFNTTFRNGVSIATGDVNKDGKSDIIVGAGPGGGPHVKVFDGSTGQEIRSFFAFGSNFRGGVNVAAGDINDDGRADIVVGAGAGGGPNVKVYDGSSMAVIRDFFAFDKGFTGGVSIAAGDLNNDGRAELLIGQASGGSTVTLISGANGASSLTYSFTGVKGVRVAISDINGDGILDPIIASGPGSKSLIRVLRADGSLFREISPFDSFTGGVFIG